MSILNSVDATIDQRDTIFSSPLAMFEKKMYNDIFTEFSEEKILPTPVDRFASVYTFVRQPTVVGVMKTSDATISARISLRNTTTGALVAADVGYSILPIPLSTIWRTKEVFIDEELVSSESTNAGLISYIKYITRTQPSQMKDSQQLNLAYFDTSGHMDSIVGWDDQANVVSVNTGGLKRVTYMQNASKIFIDKIDTVLFDEGGDDVWIPTTFKLKLRFTRETKGRVFHGVFDNGLFNVALEDFHIKIPVYKPKLQLSNAINTMLLSQSAECIYYTSSFSVIPIPVPAARRRHNEIDIFNGNCPTRLNVNARLYRSHIIVKKAISQFA